MAKEQFFTADEKKSLNTVLKSHKILLIVVLVTTPFILMFTPANKYLVFGVLVLLELVVLYRIYSYRKDRGEEPIKERLQYKGFDFTGKHTFYRDSGKKVKLIYIPLEIQNAFEQGGVYDVYYLKNSKVFAKVTSGKLNKKSKK